MNDLFVFLLSVAGLVVSIIAFVAVYQLFAIRHALDVLVAAQTGTPLPRRSFPVVRDYVPAEGKPSGGAALYPKAIVLLCIVLIAVLLIVAAVPR